MFTHFDSFPDLYSGAKESRSPWHPPRAYRVVVLPGDKRVTDMHVLATALATRRSRFRLDLVLVAGPRSSCCPSDSDLSGAGGRLQATTPTSCDYAVLPAEALRTRCRSTSNVESVDRARRERIVHLACLGGLDYWRIRLRSTFAERPRATTALLFAGPARTTRARSRALRRFDPCREPRPRPRSLLPRGGNREFCRRRCAKL